MTVIIGPRNAFTVVVLSRCARGVSFTRVSLGEHTVGS